jgi:hypothetical protein
MLCNHGARDRSHGCVFWLAVSQPLDAVASDGAARRVRLIVGLSIGVGDIDLEAGGRFALTIFYLPVLWLISAAVVGGVCVGGLAICDKRGVRASRGLAVALAGAGVIEALLFGLAVMIGHNYAAGRRASGAEPLAVSSGYEHPHMPPIARLTAVRRQPVIAFG